LEQCPPRERLQNAILAERFANRQKPYQIEALIAKHRL